MDGIELLERLKAEGHQLPTIMITGYGDVPLAVRAMNAGAAGSSRSRSVAMSCLPPSTARWNRRAARPSLLTCAMRQQRASPPSRPVNVGCWIW